MDYVEAVVCKKAISFALNLGLDNVVFDGNSETAINLRPLALTPDVLVPSAILLIYIFIYYKLYYIKLLQINIVGSENLWPRPTLH